MTVLPGYECVLIVHTKECSLSVLVVHNIAT